MTIEHSKLPPSSAARRMACPGSRAMSERHGRNEESEASEEGTRAHELCAEWLTLFGFDETKDAIDCTIDCSHEMIEGARLYKSTIKQFLSFDAVHIEERVDITNVHPDMWGTPDAWGINEDGILHVFDYKFGHAPVDAYENWQLIAYACGIIKDFPDVSLIYLHIIQPRDFQSSSPHKVWKVTAKELESYRHRLITSEALSMSSHPELKVNAECKYCPARHACPALKKAAFGATELSFRDAPQGLTPKEIGSELKMLEDAQELLEYRISALRTEVAYLLTSGKNVEFYEMKATTGKLTWDICADEVLSMGGVFGVNLRKNDVITPTQAIKAGMNEEIVLKYANRKTSLKLARVDVSKVKAVFNQP